jgi:Flp pilus assembly protein TadG
MKSRVKSRARQHGLALVELGISIFILITIAFGIMEFGRAIYQYNTLAKAVRDATRLLSTRDPLDTDAKVQARCLAVYGKASATPVTCATLDDPSPVPLTPGLTWAMVGICDALACPADHAAQGSAPVVNLVTVSIGGQNATPYTFNSIGSFVLPNIQFGPISATMKQVL